MILDNRTGLAFDYRRRCGVLDAAILAPEHAPAWMRERARLWNDVEAAEKRKDAQLARDIELALPHELTHAARRDLVHGFVRAAFVDDGMVADIALHAPDGDERNHHAHILLTLRAIEGESFGPKARAWNDAARLEQWRALWADHVNRALARAGERGRVDHRSLEAQGVDRLPQIHLGRAVIEMQRRGVATDRAGLAQEIARANAALLSPSHSGGRRLPERARREAVERRQAVTAPELPRQSLRVSTAPQSARRPPPKILGVSALFRRLDRALAGCGLWRMRQDFKARATITGRGIRIDPKVYEAAALYLSDTFEQLNLLNNDAGSDSNFDEGFDNNENGISLRL